MEYFFCYKIIVLMVGMYLLTISKSRLRGQRGLNFIVFYTLIYEETQINNIKFNNFQFHVKQH